MITPVPVPVNSMGGNVPVNVWVTEIPAVFVPVAEIKIRPVLGVRVQVLFSVMAVPVVCEKVQSPVPNMTFPAIVIVPWQLTAWPLASNVPDTPKLEL